MKCNTNGASDQGKKRTYKSGRGKGNPTGWIARVSRGQILFEMDGVSLSNARQAATLAARINYVRQGPAGLASHEIAHKL
ncbi:hypothetical protein H5410_015111 [Solanum commersonii]|uniref:Ribosomal protein L16 n=1 Tax=Solanum commersonii TaxID=4109 RepID=A0A9J5ZTG9_SOLCO|nr:hypothetical protein H5410_015111 [Solanum commersonii]